MADTTSHDTVGASTLATPLFMPSSPPPHPDHGDSYSPISTKSLRFSRRVSTRSADDGARSPKDPSPRSSRASSLERAAFEIDARLAQYTVDFSQFPSNQALDEEPLGDLKLPHEENLSDVGGPDDFTANMEKYLMSDDDTMDHRHFDADRLEPELFGPEPESEPEHDSEPELDLQEGEEEEEEEEYPQPQAQPQHYAEKGQPPQQEEQQQSSQLHQPAVEDEPELGEYSEFGPPVDMSTPSHLLRRAGGLAKDVTHLENIEEYPDAELEATTTTPSVRKHKCTSSKGEKDITEDLRKQIAELKNALRERDEQLERNRRRVLEAASAGEQIKHLQGELQRKSTLLEELYANRSDEALLRQQIHLLQKQNDEKESFLHKSTFNSSELSTLQKQISDMQKELQSRSTPVNTDLDTERLETIAHLRQQLDSAQEHLKTRDATLDQTLARQESDKDWKDQQLLAKNTEIDALKAQASSNLLRAEKLQAELDRANQAYQTLEEKLLTLEFKNRPLEEKNSTLEADLTRAQSQVTAQENALKAMAADLPLETGNTYSEILELIKDLGQPTTRRTPDPFSVSKDRYPADSETKQLQDEITKLQADLTDACSARKTLEVQLTHSENQATESQTLIHSIETENTRLTKRADELKSHLDKAQHELNQVKDERTRALETIARLTKELETQRQQQQPPLQPPQQPSPPPTPPTPRQTDPSPSTLDNERLQTELRAQRVAHTAELANLRASHAASTRDLQSLLSAAEHRESKLKSHLLAHRDRHNSLRARIESLESRIARSVEKREKEWQRRVDLLLKERERMSRALMWSWGEKELGNGNGNGRRGGGDDDDDKENVNVNLNVDEKGRRKQAYRYKFAQAHGHPPSQVSGKVAQSKRG
ncbi:hypothetical protein BO70DRAFT_371653 [Aspergillus heteromorphus CBS 117.55]|uniref:Spindle pole body associated protein SnaD n=1 Tax=Aspergillus heteromorphus CBS 117.55 TaxID=1448321 RepID=A0A317VZ96_9EURO|nr:uncharacterized protein BO70DRAFT_371653 [Aspergillus heteromorphus CBS 117.55]PWY79583.1 hypothetical protein BO70DRAFT_371653 [Aspergillus heteromorphus CBS 117.55]